jgi:outer membrane protein assembly factor BamD (BamD/ComL family)
MKTAQDAAARSAGNPDESRSAVSRPDAGAYARGMRKAFAVTSLAFLSACASSPPAIATDAEQVLSEAEALLAANNATAARNLLRERQPATFPLRLRDRYDLLLGRAQLQTDQPWDAYRTIRDFADQYPHSELRPAVMDLEYEAGRALVSSGRGFLFFWSDLRGGRECLEHLITRYPENPHLADALRLLGDIAYADGDWQRAQERYRDIVRHRPESEWAPYANFRYAMSIFASLQGPEYDLDEMQHASKELTAFLASPPENPRFVAEAKAALATLLRWRAERHLQVARFYRRVHNHFGYVENLQKAAADEFAETPSGQEARRLLALEQPAGAGR